MICPRCYKQLPEAQASCPACGLDLAFVEAIAKLKGGLARASGNLGELRESLGDLQRQADSLDALAAHQLTTASRPAIPPERADAPRQDAVREAAIEAGTVGDETAPTSPEPQEAPGVESVAASDPPPLAVPLAGAGGRAAPPTWPPGGIAPRGPESHEPGLAEINIGLRWLLIAGLVFLVLSVGWFLKYTFDKGWVGEAGRVAMAYGAGMVCLGIGEAFRRKKLVLFGLCLFGAGIAVLYFASYAAFQIYELMRQELAFGLMVLVTALAAAAALRYDTKWLAVLGIIGGFLTPIVLSTDVDNQIVLMTYMLILNGGILAIATLRRWSLLNYLGFVCTWLLFTGWFVRHYHETKFWPTLIFLNLFFLIHAFVPFAYYFVRTTKHRMRGFAITIPNAFLGFGYSAVMINEVYMLEGVSIVSVAYAAIFLAMAAFLFRRHRENTEAFILMLAKGMLFLVLTVPILFSAHWITVFWSLQAIVLVWAALKVGNERLRDAAVLLLLLATGKFVVYDYVEVFHLYIEDVYYRGGFTEDLLARWVTTAMVIVTLFRSAQMLAARSRKQDDRPSVEQVGAWILYGTFAGVLFLALNVETSAFFHEYAPGARFAATSVLWALFSIALMVLGFVRNLALLRRCSIGLFAVTALKVLIKDMGNVSTPYRIVSFMVLGLMLIGASYLYHRYKSRILPSGGA